MHASEDVEILKHFPIVEVVGILLVIAGIILMRRLKRRQSLPPKAQR